MKNRQMPPSHKEIFEEWFQESAKEGKGGAIKRFFRKIFRKLAPFKKIIFSFFIIVFILLLVFVIFKIIVSPPRYSQEKTQREAKEFQKLIQQQEPQHQKKLQAAYDILKKYPYFHKEVVNNTDEIKVDTRCEYMCAGRETTLADLKDLILHPPYQGVTTLHINPKHIDKQAPETLAGSFVHEANHFQFYKSGKLRKAALVVKCNPLFNTDISISSNVPTLQHRVKSFEICAIREENNFHEAVGSNSPHKGKSVFVVFFYSVIDALKIIWHTFISFFN